MLPNKTGNINSPQTEKHKKEENLKINIYMSSEVQLKKIQTKSIHIVTSV